MKKYLVLQTDGDFKEVHEEDYKSTYALLRDNVEGSIEHISWIKAFDERGIDLWINDEGKLIDLDPTVALFDDGNIVEVLNGNIVFSRYDSDGKTLPLTDEDITFIKNYMNKTSGVIRYISNITGTELINWVSFINL